MIYDMQMNDNYDNSFVDCEREGLYKAIYARRDVRSNFIDREIPDYILAQILKAAHHAPSVGYSQPWDFILIKDYANRLLVKNSFINEREKSISLLKGDKERQKLYLRLKLEGIVESAINICVTYNPTKFGPFVLGRTSVPETGVYSVCCAIQNLWLAARVEGIGVGWVSILSTADLKKILSIPDHVLPVAYLCLGYVNEFSAKPDLENVGWLERMALKDVIHYEKWKGLQNDLWNDLHNSFDEVR
ncbi:MAG: 5,6-dimethylbenzimidazole synthase [Nitrososphaerota archaeon]